MRGTYDGEAARERIRAVPAGPQRTEAWRKAIHEADLAQDDYWRQDLRADMILYTGFYDDATKILPVCAEFFALYEQCPDATPTGLGNYNCYIAAHDAAELCVLLPQLDMPTCEGLLDQLDRVVERIGDGMQRRSLAFCEFYTYVDPEKAQTWYERFRKPCRDEFSPCRACRQNFKVWYMLHAEQRHQAEELAKPIFSGKYTCDSVPSATYASFIEYYLNHGEIEKATEYVPRLVFKYLRDRSDVEYMGAALRGLAYSDLKTGWKLLPKALDWTTNMWNQQALYYFYKGAWKLCQKLAEKPPKKLSRLLPPVDHPICDIGRPYTPERMMDWFYEQAKKIAGRFDKRNGTDWYASDLRKAE